MSILVECKIFYKIQRTRSYLEWFYVKNAKLEQNVWVLFLRLRICHGTTTAVVRYKEHKC